MIIEISSILTPCPIAVTSTIMTAAARTLGRGVLVPFRPRTGAVTRVAWSRRGAGFRVLCSVVLPVAVGVSEGRSIGDCVLMGLVFHARVGAWW